jgi:hypothetical protein
MSMTIDELLAREAIRKTMANYTLAGDRLRTEDFIAAFTEDGILESDGVPEEDSFRYVGHEELREWMNRWTRQPADERPSTHQASFVRHHLATSQIELTGPDSARARTYWMAYTDIGADHCGYYIDSFRKIGDRWLIAHRRVRMDWRSPDSLFKTAVAHSRN